MKRISPQQLAVYHLFRRHEPGSQPRDFSGLASSWSRLYPGPG